MNHLRKGAMVGLGHPLKLDLSRIDAGEFETARRRYHRDLQNAYFAEHRIAATQNYEIKHGDSLWTIAHQHGDLPIWLVTQYNPDANFRDMRPGQAITLPRSSRSIASDAASLHEGREQPAWGSGPV